jgi:hypothetical protein
MKYTPVLELSLFLVTRDADAWLPSEGDDKRSRDRLSS